VASQVAWKAKQGATIDHRYLEIFGASPDDLARAVPLQSFSVLDVNAPSQHAGSTALALLGDVGSIGGHQQQVAVCGYGQVGVPQLAHQRMGPY